MYAKKWGRRGPFRLLVADVFSRLELLPDSLVSLDAYLHYVLIKVGISLTF
jgi:hypothetical protein